MCFCDSDCFGKSLLGFTQNISQLWQRGRESTNKQTTKKKKTNRIIMAIHPAEIGWQLRKCDKMHTKQTTVTKELSLNCITNNPKRKRREAEREREVKKKADEFQRGERERGRVEGSLMKKQSDYVPGSLSDLRILCLWMKPVTGFGWWDSRRL